MPPLAVCQGTSALFFFSLVLLVEALHASCGIDDLLLTGEKGMALVAELDSQGLPGRAGGKGVAAGAGYLGIVVIFRMDFLFHCSCPG